MKIMYEICYVNNKGNKQREWHCPGVVVFDFRGTFTTHLKIYNEAFLRRYLTDKS